MKRSHDMHTLIVRNYPATCPILLQHTVDSSLPPMLLIPQLSPFRPDKNPSDQTDQTLTDIPVSTTGYIHGLLYGDASGRLREQG